MVAAFNVEWDFGGSANAPGTVEQVVTNLRFNNEDTNDQDTASPVTVPTAGTNYSFWKQLYLACRTTAPSVQVNSVKVYTDGTLDGAGGEWVGSTVVTSDEVLAHNIAGDAGYDPGQALIGTTHDTVVGTTSLFTFNSGSPKSMTISEAGSIINAIGEFTDYLFLQEELGTTGLAGVQGTETITWQYDEI